MCRVCASDAVGQSEAPGEDLHRVNLGSIAPRSGKVVEMSRENWTDDDREQFAKFMAAAPEELSAYQLEVLRRNYSAAARRIADRGISHD